MDFAYKNGCDALALTDHGNMNGLAYQVLHAKKMKEAGIPLEDEPLVYSAGFMSVAMTAFGEMNVIYNITQ